MALNPCLCIPLWKGVKILAVVDMIFNIIIFVLSVFAVLVVLSMKGEQAGAGNRKATGILVIVVTVLVLTMLQFLLASRLKSGAENEDFRKCRFWWFSASVMFTIYIILLVSNRTSETFQVVELVVFSVLILYKVFGIAVVVTYTESLKQNDQLGIHPTVPPSRPGSIPPTSQIYTVDLPPSYLEIENETENVEPPPPYSTDLVTVLQSINVKSEV